MLKGWRTILVNALVIAAGVAAYLDAAGIKDILPPGYAWVPVAIGVANIVLRIVTTTAVGQKS